MLSLVALTRSGRISRERLAEQLWPDDFFDATRLRLRQELHRLKKTLGDDGEVIGSSATEIWVDRTLITTDLETLEVAIVSGERIDERLLLEPLLPEWDDEWVASYRSQAEKLQIRAATALVTRALQRGEARSVQDLLNSLIALHPLNEELRKLAVEVHAQLGSLTDAVAEFQDYRLKVKEQLGVEPKDLSERIAREVAQRQAEAAARPDWTDTIPAATEPVFGRDQLAERVRDLLISSGMRVVTLVGPGGIGKTRLATEVARGLVEEGAKVIFISLADVEVPTLWPREALAQMRCDPPSESDALKFLSATIGQDPTILVLDNLETILPEAESSIAELLRLNPKLTLLMTSVKPSRVRGEHLISVGPIDRDQASLKLLKSAWNQYRPHATLSDAELESLNKIAEELDGYPLSLRLASARLRLLSPSDLLRQLQQAMTRTMGHDLPERHRSLESALASSFEGLAEPLQRFLTRVSAYPGGMGMDLCGLVFEDEPYLDMIEALLDSALLILDDHAGFVRVRMLAPVRAFIRARLPDLEIESLDEQAIRSLLNFTSRQQASPWTPLALRTLDLMESEADNLLYAWRWALLNDPDAAWKVAPQIMRLEATRGRGVALVDQLQPFVESWGALESTLAIDLNLGFAHLALACHREDRVPACLERARALPGPSVDQTALISLTEALFAFRRDFNSCEAAALRSIQISEEAGNTYYASRARRMMALAMNYRNQSEESARYLELAFEGLKLSGAESELPGLAVFLGVSLWFLGQTEKAQPILDWAVTQMPRLRDPVTLAFWNESEGRLALAQGRIDDAEARFLESLKLWRAMGSAYQEADQLHSLCRTYIKAQRWEDARTAVLQAAAKWVEDDNYGGLCCTIAAAAAVLVHDGKPAQAARALSFAEDLERQFELIVVEDEHRHREALRAQVGECDHGLPVTKEQAFQLFDWIRQ